MPLGLTQAQLDAMSRAQVLAYLQTLPPETIERGCALLHAPSLPTRPPVTLRDLKIRTKGKQLVPLTPNEVQETYLDMLTRDYPPFDWRNGVYTLRGVRDDILKARQQGMSTLWLALYFLDTINMPLTQTVVAADTGERSEMLFKIIHRFYENLPQEKKRPKKYSTRKEIEFSDTDSVIYVGTADVFKCENLEQVATLHGRWEPYQFAHLLCELGWWYAYHGYQSDEPALLIVERENHGHAVNGFLQHDPFNYPLQVRNACSGLYVHDPVNLTGRQVYRGTQGQNKLVGWPSGSAKGYADDTCAKYISDAEEAGAGVWMNDRDTVSECLTYVHLPGGAAGGESGSHDDRVRSIALCCAGHALCYQRALASAAEREERSAGYGGYGGSRGYPSPGYGSARGETRW